MAPASASGFYAKTAALGNRSPELVDANDRPGRVCHRPCARAARRLPVGVRSTKIGHPFRLAARRSRSRYRRRKDVKVERVEWIVVPGALRSPPRRSPTARSIGGRTHPPIWLGSSPPIPTSRSKIPIRSATWDCCGSTGIVNLIWGEQNESGPDARSRGREGPPPLVRPIGSPPRLGRYAASSAR